MSFEIDKLDLTFTNPSGDKIGATLLQAPLFDEYLNKPRRALLHLEKGHSIDPLATVSMSYKGSIKLVGYIDRLDQADSQEDLLTIKSAEGLLEHRITQWYRYPIGTTLNDILSSSPGGPVVGLLFIANSLVSRGSFIQEGTTNVYKWSGAGSGSRLGSLAAVYEDTTLLTKVYSMPTAAGQFYQDGTDLYIWTTDNRDPVYHMILIPNYKDTLIRLGNISEGSKTFNVAFETSASRLWPIIEALVLGMGLEYQFRYDKDGYVYLDAMETVGGGSVTDPIRIFIHGRKAEVTTSPIDGGLLQSLIGLGAGSGPTQQAASISNLTDSGVWKEAVYSSPALAAENLRVATEKVFLEDYSDPLVYMVRATDPDWSLSRGDWIQIQRPGYQPVNKRIKHINYRSTTEMKIEAGQRLLTFQELIQGKTNVLDVLTSFYGAHSPNAYSWSFGPDNVDTNVPLEKEFELKDSEENGVIDPDYPYVVTLNVSIDWYKTNADGNDKAKPHSAVGGHGGYGGGGGGSGGGGQTHNITTCPVSTPSAFTPVVNNVENIGACNSSVSVLDSISGYLIFYFGCSPYDCVNDADFDLNEYYGSAASSSHSHSVGSAVGEAASKDHVHIYPGGTTNESATPFMTAQARAGSVTHPTEPIELLARLALFSTKASIAYLTIAIKANGVHVPGSPFSGELGTGLYIGDRLDNIDITDLVTVGQTNKLTFEVSEFGGSPDVVRCCLSGSVNVAGVISF